MSDARTNQRLLGFLLALALIVIVLLSIGLVLVTSQKQTILLPRELVENVQMMTAPVKQSRDDDKELGRRPCANGQFLVYITCYRYSILHNNLN